MSTAKLPSRLLLRLALPLALLAGAPGFAHADPADPAQAAAAPQGGGDDASSHDPLQQWLSQNGLVQQVSTRAADLVVNAMGLLGARYKYGGNGSDSDSGGFDCSGFVRHVYEESLGMVLPHNAAQQSRVGERIDASQLRPGDLVFFNTLRHAFSHVGIYIGNGQFIHAPRPGQSVQIGSLDSPYWARRFDGARRMIKSVADKVLPPAEAAAPEQPAATDPAAALAAQPGDLPAPH